MNLKEGNQRYYLEDDTGKEIGEICYTVTADGNYNVHHTYSSPSVRGQGIGDKLLDVMADKAREDQKKIVPSCSFVAKRFNEYDKYDDVIYDPSIKAEEKIFPACGLRKPNS